jgi:hypothetical protein
MGVLVDIFKNHGEILEEDFGNLEIASNTRNNKEKNLKMN